MWSTDKSVSQILAQELAVEKKRKVTEKIDLGGDIEFIVVQHAYKVETTLNQH